MTDLPINPLLAELLEESEFSGFDFYAFQSPFGGYLWVESPFGKPQREYMNPNEWFIASMNIMDAVLLKNSKEHNCIIRKGKTPLTCPECRGNLSASAIYTDDDIMWECMICGCTKSVYDLSHPVRNVFYLNRK